MNRTPDQAEASRQNGAKSQGPLHPNSSQNAVKSGIDSPSPLLESLGESRAQRIGMLNQYLHSVRPQNRSELTAMKALFQAEIRMDRVARYENHVTAALLERTNGNLGEAILLSDSTRGCSLDRLSRQGTAALNRYVKAVKLLKDLRQEPCTLNSNPESIPTAGEILDEIIAEANVRNKPENPQPAENTESPAVPPGVELARTASGAQPAENQGSPQAEHRTATSIAPSLPPTSASCTASGANRTS